MIINHHFRVEYKAHNFNLSIINKRFSLPVISILTSNFLSPTDLGQALAEHITRKGQNVQTQYVVTVCAAVSQIFPTILVAMVDIIFIFQPDYKLFVRE